MWKSLRKLFQGLIDDTKKGGGVISNRGFHNFMKSNAVSQFLNRVLSKMTHTIRVDTAGSWREAATKGNNGSKINGIIRNEMKGNVGFVVQNIISENAKYIKTLPDEWAVYASNYAAQMTMKGERPELVEAHLRKVVPEHMQKNLKTIARTECAKANAAIVQARAEMCGIRAYIWRSVKDERARPAHRAMDGIMVFFDDPPSPEALFPIPTYFNQEGIPYIPPPYGEYHAGNTFNCRCYMEPVVDISFLPDVIKVHDHGEIRKMTKAQIKREYGNIS